jgi:hypothetical protein
MDLIHNERIKLLATFLNSSGVAVLGIGGLSPLILMISNGGELRMGLLVISVVCILSATGLHYMGSRVLQRMKP